MTDMPRFWVGSAEDGRTWTLGIDMRGDLWLLRVTRSQSSNKEALHPFDSESDARDGAEAIIDLLGLNIMEKRNAA